MKLLIAIDGSETALRALHYVVDHPDFFGDNAELLLVFVHLPVPSSRVKAIVGNDVIEQYYKDESEEALGPTRELLAGKAYRVTERPLIGQPAAEIIATAQGNGCDLVVMGTQGRSAFGNLIMGSVAMRVIANSTVPVLSIK